MPQTYKSPGVYREEIVLAPPAPLETGVPVFVGFADLLASSQAQFNQPVALHHQDDFTANFQNRPDSFLNDAIRGFFATGGLRCYVVCADPASVDRSAALQQAIKTLMSIDDLDLIAAPDAMCLANMAVDPTFGPIEQIRSQLDQALVQATQVQSAMLSHCGDRGDRFAILDALPVRPPMPSLPPVGATDAFSLQYKSLTTGRLEPVNGALYYPWLKTVEGRIVPPCGHVAGVYALTDAKTGVFKAPANEEVQSVLDLDAMVDDSVQDMLNPAGVNCLRAFPGRGIRVWGARTINRDPNWRYVNVRRLFLTLRRWTNLNMAWISFEPNSTRLWLRIQRELGTYLSGLQQDGALQGTTPEEAFYIKCDDENNPPEVRDAGQVVIEVGLAPLAPSEFIVAKIIFWAGTGGNG